MAEEEPVTFEHFQIARREDGTLFELGRGAMGVTYKAYDTRLEGYVALKVINSGYLHDDVGRERFLREARAAAHLDHPNVAAIFHRGQEGGTFFYAMQFIEGETLDAFVRRRGPLPVALALRLVLQAAQGLSAANARGLIHRDIKPANLMVVHLDDNGLASTNGDQGDDLLVKVIDFGLAKVVQTETTPSSQLSLTGGGPIGTPYYMSPEQIDSAVGEVDARSDIYSLGVTLWYLLTGQPPFVGSQFQVFKQHMSAPPPLAQLPVFVPDSVRSLLERMMAKHPSDRPANTRELIGILRELLRTPLTPNDSTGGTGAAAVAAPPYEHDASSLTLAEPPSSAGSGAPPFVPPPPSPGGTSAARSGPPPPPPYNPPSAPPYNPPPAAPVNVPPPMTPLVTRQLPPAVPPPGQGPSGWPPQGYPPPNYQPPGYQPPGYQPKPAGSSHARAWIIFSVVFVTVLALGGGLLAYFVHQWNIENEREQARRKDRQHESSPSPDTPTPVTPVPVTPPGKDDLSTFLASGGRTLTVPGQYATVQAAVDEAHSGDTVKVGAGTYAGPVKFKAGLHLVGAGAASTIVRTDGRDAVLNVAGCGSGTVSGFTFEHAAHTPTKDHIVGVWIGESAIQLQDCVVKNSDNIGIQCSRGDHSTILRCEVSGAHATGILVAGAGTVVTLRGNNVHHSTAAGVIFSEGAMGTAEDNASEDNGQSGMTVMNKDSAADLRGNRIRRNKLSGICFQDGAVGTASDNTIEANVEAGIRVSETGTGPTLSKNHIRENKLSGIVFANGAGGIATTNTIEDNVEAGIAVQNEGTTPVLNGNRISGNKLSGIVFDTGSKGTAESNISENNTWSGILVLAKGSSPTLRNNQLRNNKADGICFQTGAGGLADANVCENNARYGILAMGAGTAPVLHENKCTGNKVENVSVQSGATTKTSTSQFNDFFN